MNRILHRALLSLLTCSCLTGTLATAAESPRSGQLLFGWASQSITPNKPVAVGGQYHTRISGVVHDPLSADFWHDARKLLREKYHTDLYVLPLVGAAGDQSPHLLSNNSAEAAMRQRRKLTNREEIARRILRAVEDVEALARPEPQRELLFQHRVARVPLPVWQVSDERCAQAQAVVEAGRDKTESLPSQEYINWRVSRTLAARHALQKQEPCYQAELHFLRLGELAVATNPFELFADYGLQIKACSPAVQTCVVQLTADCAAYLPTERAVRAGGYSARIDDGVVGPQGGKVLVEQTARILKEICDHLWQRRSGRPTCRWARHNPVDHPTELV